ncbi:hypothetical protein IFM89_004907, partial [Coptis chinensis]
TFVNDGVGNCHQVPQRAGDLGKGDDSIVGDHHVLSRFETKLDPMGNSRGGLHLHPIKEKVHNQIVGKVSNGRSQPRTVSDEKVREMKDQVIRAKEYLNFAPPGSNSHLVKELRLRIKEIEREVGEASKDLDLSRRYANA